LNKVLIIGYGNSLAGDDALGYNVIRRIQDEYEAKGISVRYIHQLMPEHAEEISLHDSVVFIDAEEGSPAGRIRIAEVKKADLRDTSAAAHEYTLDSILLLAERLYNRLPRVYLVTVTGKSFEMGEMLSAEVAAKLPEVLQIIKSIVQKESAVEAAEYA
jgi:hydrogenase maturation protease